MREKLDEMYHVCAVSRTAAWAMCLAVGRALVDAYDASEFDETDETKALTRLEGLVESVIHRMDGARAALFALQCNLTDTKARLDHASYVARRQWEDATYSFKREEVEATA